MLLAAPLRANELLLTVKHADVCENPSGFTRLYDVEASGKQYEIIVHKHNKQSSHRVPFIEHLTLCQAPNLKPPVD